MILPPAWQAIPLALGLVFAASLLLVWWRQQTYRWALVGAACLLAAPLISWWSGVAFQVTDYRAGCDGLCPGYRGAPVRFVTGQAAGGVLLSGMFVLNSLAYLVILLAWGAAIFATLRVRKGSAEAKGRGLGRLAIILTLIVTPLALAPLVLPPPEAHVRGDPLRIAINARREVYMYDQLSPAPVLRVGLDDVRPRRDAQQGMRVCLRTYTLFYLPTGFMFLDMAPDGVHSTSGGALPLAASCWI